MPVFAYVAQNAASGKQVKGKIEADSLKDAKVKLRRQKLYVLQCKESNDAAAASGKSSLWQSLNRRPPKQEDVGQATKQFAVLTRAAVDLSESLRAISEQVENPELRAIYVRMRELVSEGKSLADAHREFPKVFTPIYVNMIAAAEKSGALTVVLQRLSEFIFWSISIRRKVIGALSYPAFMLVMSMAIVIFLFVNILPKMTKALASMRVTLPWYTKLLNDISALMQAYWMHGILLFTVSTIAYVMWSRTAKGRRTIHRYMYRAPLFGPLIQRVAISRFAKTLSTVLTSGIRIIEGLRLTRNVVDNAVLEEALDKTIALVQDGDKLAAALEKTGVMPPMVLHMVRTGEKTGRLEDMLVNVAEAYDEEVDDRISSTTRAIQPILIVFIAGIVALIVVSVMGPLMQTMQSIK